VIYKWKTPSQFQTLRQFLKKYNIQTN